MSIITPRTYKLLADDYGSAYAAIRDAIFQDGAGYASSAYGVMQAALARLSGTDDTDTQGCGAAEVGEGESETPTDAGYSEWTIGVRYTAPPGSIASDLGTKFYTFANSTLGEAQAKRTAASTFSASLRTLNSHIVNRLYGYSSISSFYTSYASIAGNQENSLFDDAVGTPYQNYFTTDFQELSGLVGTTIADSLVS